MTTRTRALVLEEGRRLSESLVWDVQRRFYEQRGPSAWSDGGLPWYATSNAFVARGYARVVAGFLADCLRQGALDATQPVHVVELASGSGHLAFLRCASSRRSARRTPSCAACPGVWS